MKRNYLNQTENPDYQYDSDKDCCVCPECVNIKFYRCEICGQIVASIGELANPISCCGKEVQELIPGSVDAKPEYHIPVCTKSGHKLIVEIGELEHPALEEHHIEWICLVTNFGIQWHPLSFDDEPCTIFRLRGNEKVLAVYAHCNKHGLWCCSDCCRR